MSEPPEAPSSRLGGPLPRDLEAIVLRALAKDPAQRYASAADLALALAACDLAGKWTFGEAAAHVARLSSRPPPSSEEQLVSLAAPRLPSFSLDVELPTLAGARPGRLRDPSHPE